MIVTKTIEKPLLDEFKSVRGVSGAMSFIMMDGQTQRLLDIVENRQLPFLKRYYYMRFFVDLPTCLDIFL